MPNKKRELKKEDLIELYINQGLIIRDVAKKLRCNYHTVRRYLDEYGIPKRKKGEGKNSAHFNKGHKPWNKNLKGIHLSPESEWKKGQKPWNAGQFKDYDLLRQIKNTGKIKDWKVIVKERDGKCMDCGSTENLNAHHMIPIIKIIEDYKINNIYEALECDFLWDLNNGRTLCENCHIEHHKKAGDYNYRLNEY